MKIVVETLDIALTAAPWLLLGLVVAGLVKASLPERHLQYWIGGSGMRSVSKAAVIGAPLPLCSCGAIPTAVTLYRGGVRRGPTTAFLIGAPGVGADSVALTYALLGPFMMVARVTSAVVTAMATGCLVGVLRPRAAGAATDDEPATPECAADDCCRVTASARAGDCCGERPRPATLLERLRRGLGYAFGDFYDEISVWMAAGLILAGGLAAWLDPSTLAELGTGPLAIVIMAVIGIPLYVGATAATPVAVGLLVAGVSPGAVITFLVAGPVTSLATLGVLRREMGTRVLFGYLAGIVGSAVGIGFAVNRIVAGAGVDIGHQLGSGGALVPYWLKVAALVALVLIAIRPLRRWAGRQTGWTPVPTRA